MRGSGFVSNRNTAVKIWWAQQLRKKVKMSQHRKKLVHLTFFCSSMEHIQQWVKIWIIMKFKFIIQLTAQIPIYLKEAESFFQLMSTYVDKLLIIKFPRIHTPNFRRSVFVEIGLRWTRRLSMCNNWSSNRQSVCGCFLKRSVSLLPFIRVLCACLCVVRLAWIDCSSISNNLNASDVSMSPIEKPLFEWTIPSACPLEQ